MNHTEQDFSERVSILMARMNIRSKETFAKELGIGRTTLYYNETDENQPPSKKTLARLNELEQKHGIKTEHGVQPVLKEPVHMYGGSDREPRMIPVISWAHAGDAQDYEELPEDWQDEVPTLCRDKKAFGLKLEGSSMTPRFHEGAELVITPSSEPYSGQYVVVKFKEHGGVLFRRLEIERDIFRLVPENDRYPVGEYQAEDFEWIYPVFGVFEKLMK